MMKQLKAGNRGSFIGGSDARIISWATMRPLCSASGGKNGVKSSRRTFRETSLSSWAPSPSSSTGTGMSAIVTDVQRRVFHPVKRWMAATLDGMVEGAGAVFEAKFMLPWAFSDEAAAAKHMPQLQHNMWVIQSRSAALSIITGGGKLVELTIHADPLYQHLLLTAERKFWRCVE